MVKFGKNIRSCLFVVSYLHNSIAITLSENLWAPPNQIYSVHAGNNKIDKHARLFPGQSMNRSSSRELWGSQYSHPPQNQIGFLEIYLSIDQ